MTQQLPIVLFRLLTKRLSAVIAEKEILIVVASLVFQCCAIKKNIIVASQLYDVTDV